MPLIDTKGMVDRAAEVLVPKLKTIIDSAIRDAVGGLDALLSGREITIKITIGEKLNDNPMLDATSGAVVAASGGPDQGSTDARSTSA